MDELLAIKEVARRLGVSVDAVRQWERDGKLAAVRTAGGHRRFRLTDVEKLSPQTTVHAPTEGRKETGAQPAGGAESVKKRSGLGPNSPAYWDSQVMGARAQVELLRLQCEQQAHEAALRKAEEREHLEMGGHERAYQQQSYLSDLKEYGRALLGKQISPEWKAQVSRDLEVFVVAGQFPLGMPMADARVLVKAHVELKLRSLENERTAMEEKARAEAKAASDRQHVQHLIQRGKTSLVLKTFRWNNLDIVRVERDVLEAMNEEVDASWTMEQVEGLVDEVMAAYRTEQSSEEVGQAEGELEDEDYDDEDDNEDDEDDDVDEDEGGWEKRRAY